MCKIWFIGFLKGDTAITKWEKLLNYTLHILSNIVGTFFYNVTDEKMSSSEDRVKNKLELLLKGVSCESLVSNLVLC